jgi:hypothetical protein
VETRRSLSVGGGVFGVPFMKFNLTYEGQLPSSGNKAKIEDVWRIRKEFHPQLVDLWASHPALKAVEDNRHFPKTGGATLAQTHHDHPGPIVPVARERLTSPPRSDILDLCEDIKKHGKLFRPLVRNSYALHCGLKILFLRKEPPGKVYQGGDVDGRMKTLLDALSMAQHVEQVLNDSAAPARLYCLLEDDSLISGLSVESERLLGAADLPGDYAKLVIEVDVRVKQTTIYNQSFLG